MGNYDSGPRPKYIFDEEMIKKIKRWRSIGHSWGHISERLGFKSETPIEKFRKENPEFDLECGEAVLNLESALLQDIIKLVRKLCADGKSPPPELVKMILSYFKVIEKDENKQITAIQVNGGAGNSNGIQVNFVAPGEAQRLEQAQQLIGDIIDAETN
jgi:hypothetical protein